MATQKHAYAQTKERSTQSGLVFYIFSTSHKWIALMLGAFHRSQSALLQRMVVTRSLEMALAPSSQGRNHLAEWQTHTYIQATQHQEAGRIWIALRQTFLTQVLYSSSALPFFCPEHTLSRTQKYLHRDSILSAFSPRSCNDKRCCPAVRHCQ